MNVGQKVAIEYGDTNFVIGTVAKVLSDHVLVNVTTNSTPPSISQRKFNLNQYREAGSPMQYTNREGCKLWQDVEKAEAEKQARIAKRAKEAQEKREAKAAAEAAQRAKEEAAVREMVEFATTLHNTEIPLEVGPAQEDAFVRRSVGQAWLDAHNTLLERARRLAQYPASYFEWAEKDMELAARLEFLERAIWDMRNAEKPCTATEAMNRLKEQLKKELLDNRYRGNSSSAAHNAMMAARVTVASNMLRGWIC